MAQFVWILDVLADLNAFARANDLPVLSQQLETTRAVAAAEIESRNAEARATANGDPAGAEPTTRRLGGHQRA